MPFTRETLTRAPLRLLGEGEHHEDSRWAHVARLVEELQLARRDLFSRLDRKIREKATPLANKMLRARRERRARSREHSQKGVMAPPRKFLSTTLRSR